MGYQLLVRESGHALGCVLGRNPLKAADFERGFAAGAPCRRATGSIPVWATNFLSERVATHWAASWDATLSRRPALGAGSLDPRREVGLVALDDFQLRGL